MMTQGPIIDRGVPRPEHGYDQPEVQSFFATRTAQRMAEFLLPHLKPGMTAIDAGCGPGSVTVGLAEAVAPAQVYGVDLEPAMVDSARELADSKGLTNVEFMVGSVTELPFPDNHFDVLFNAGVLEYLNDPMDGHREFHRVLKPGGINGTSTSDYTEPFIVPPNKHVKRFLDLFEDGMQREGGTLNRGRFLKAHMRAAGFDVVELLPRFDNFHTPEGIKDIIGEYLAFIDKLPMFHQAAELGITSRDELAEVRDGMIEWSKHPDAYLAVIRIRALAYKPR